jgi:hypothetical protein
MKFFAAIFAVCAWMSFSGAAFGAPYEYSPGDRDAWRPAGDGIRIFPESLLREYDPITLFFPEDTGKTGPEDHPEKWVVSDTRQPGEFRWIDARTLQFRPAEPWPSLRRIRWTVGGVTRTFFTLLTAPSSVSPENGSSYLDGLSEIVLTFSQKMDTDLLSSVLSLEIRPLPGLDPASGTAIPKEDYSLKALERGPSDSGSSRSYLLTLKKPVGPGNRVLLHLDLSPEPSLASYRVDFSWSTRPAFRLTEVGTGNGTLPVAERGSVYSRAEAVTAYSGDSLMLGFSDTPDELSYSEFKNLVEVEPAVEKLRCSVSGSRIYLNGSFRPDTLYEVTVKPYPIRSVSGHTLEAKGITRYSVYFPPAEKFLNWAKSEGLMERYGPRQFPLNGSGVTRADIRVYKIDPLNRNLWPFPDQPVTVDESRMPSGPGEEPSATPTTDGFPSAAEIAKHLRMLGSPPVSRVVDLPAGRTGTAAEFGIDLGSMLDEISPSNRPGTYLVGYRPIGGDAGRRFVRVQVSDLCFSSLETPFGAYLMVTSYRTALPVSGAEVSLQGYRSGALRKTHEWENLFHGITDENGRLFLPRSPLRNDWRAFMRLVVKKDDDLLVMNPDQSVPSFASGSWHESSDNWFNSLNSVVEEERPAAQGFAFTERPLYRPEEKVYLKAFVREWRNNILSQNETDKDFRFTVTGPGGKTWEFPVTMSEFGSCDLAFQDTNLPTGYYEAVLSGRENSRAVYREFARTSFQMEAYRVPTFQAVIHTLERYPMDKPFAVSLTADYYAGGKASGLPVTWRVSQFPMAYSPEGREGYLFSSDTRYSRNQNRYNDRNVMEKEGVTGEDGTASITLNPLLLLNNMPTRYVVEATLTGPSEETVTATADVSAVPAFILGLKTERYVKEGTNVRVSVIAVDHENQLAPGVAVTARLVKREWHSHLKEAPLSDGKPEYVTEQVDTPLEERLVSSGKEAVAVDFTVPGAGIYLVELEARDAVGRSQSISADVYVAGDTRLTWEKPEESLFRAVPDQTAPYQPGQTANILIQSPVADARLLAIVEKTNGTELRWMDIGGGKGSFSVPVDEKDYPRFPVTFVLMSPRADEARIKNPELRADAGKPQTWASTVWIPVSPDSRVLSVKLAYPPSAAPGSKVEMKIDLSDYRGNPVKGEVTLWLVDQAVLSLGKEGSIDPLPAFNRDVSSKILFRDLRNLAIGKLKVMENPGGEDEDYKESGARKRELAGLALLAKATVRKNFRTVAYYNASVIVEGSKTVTIEMPDNLTVFQVRAVAADQGGKFGTAKGKIEMRLPLVLQPLLPRFVRYGDELKAGGLARVVAGEGGSGKASVEVEGADLLDPAVSDLEWSPANPRKLLYRMKVVSPSFTNGEMRKGELRVKLVAARLSDEASDAFELRIPVLPDRDAVESEIVTNVVPGGAYPLPVFEFSPRKETVRQSILLTGQYPLLKMMAGMDYLMNYPHECLEQKVSRAFSAVALKSVYSRFGIDSIAPDAGPLVADAIDAAQKYRDPVGLSCYWPGSGGYVYLTAYVLEFLSGAKEAGYDVPDELFDDIVRVLKQALRSDYSRFVEGWRWDERIAALEALADAGQFDSSYASELASHAGEYTLEAQSSVLSALQRNHYFDGGLIDKLKKGLWAHALFLLRDGKETFAGIQDDNARWGGVVNASELKSQANILSALAWGEKYEGRLRLMADSLVRQGGPDGWGNTWVNSAVLRSLRDYLDAIGGEQPRVKAELPGNIPLEIGGGKLSGWWSGALPEGGSVRIDADSSRDAPAYVRMKLRYFPQTSGDDAKAVNAGFVVSREIQRVGKSNTVTERTWDDTPGKIFQFQPGEVAEEHIQLVNPEDRYFVAVTVPLAAGMEPLNPRLRNAPPEASTEGTDTLAPAYSAFLDDRVVYYFNQLPKGTFHFYFRLRAMTEGSFTEPPASAELMYDGRVRGNSPGLRVVVASGGQ